MRINARAAALSIILLVVAIVGGVVLIGTAMWVRMTEPYKGFGRVEQFVDVPRGTTVRQIADRLAEAGVVKDPYTFRAAVWWTGHAAGLKAGEYRFDRALDAIAVANRLARGDVYTRRVTFPEGLTIAEMARIFERQGLGPADAFVEAARDTALIRDFDRDATDLEGYLFPDTYTVSRGISAARLVQTMVNRFREAFPRRLQHEAAAQALSVRQVVTLASLVEKETASAGERFAVAAVYRNRMRAGMPMQADPTVVYALRLVDRYDGNIGRADLSIDSPYNTYRYPGLPPGPIASPGTASLEAVLAPAAVRFLYFVSRNDGTHVFANTLAEHNRNVQRYQVQYFREQRRRDARAAR